MPNSALLAPGVMPVKSHLSRRVETILKSKQHVPARLTAVGFCLPFCLLLVVMIHLGRLSPLIAVSAGGNAAVESAEHKALAGTTVPFPADVLPGPRVMLTSEFAGSGDDSLPWLFRQAGLGLLIGKRTAGFGIGHYANVPNLLDGGDVAAPDRAFLNPRTGAFEIENNGVTPDIQLAWTPADWRSGRDAQLERAVQVTLEALKKISNE